MRQSSVKSAVIPTPRNEVEVEVIEEALRNWSALFSMLNVHDDTAELIGNVSGLVAGGKTVARKALGECSGQINIFREGTNILRQLQVWCFPTIM